MSQSNELEAIGAALALIPSGCSVMTCRAAASSTGMLSSWVQQAAFEPPMVTVAVKRERPIHALLQDSSQFALNLLGEGDTTLLRHFGGGFGPGEPAFEGLHVEQVAHGVHIDVAIACLGCRIEARWEAGDHLLYLGQIETAYGLRSARPYVHIRKSGMSY